VIIFPHGTKQEERAVTICLMSGSGRDDLMLVTLLLVWLSEGESWW